MRLIKNCIRCNGAFPATKNMLVCGKCYGSQEDLELSRIIQRAKIIAGEELSYDRELSRIVDMIHTNAKGSIGERS